MNRYFSKLAQRSALMGETVRAGSVRSNRPLLGTDDAGSPTLEQSVETINQPPETSVVSQSFSGSSQNHLARTDTGPERKEHASMLDSTPSLVEGITQPRNSGMKKSVSGKHENEVADARAFNSVSDESVEPRVVQQKAPTPVEGARLASAQLDRTTQSVPNPLVEGRIHQQVTHTEEKNATVLPKSGRKSRDGSWRDIIDDKTNHAPQTLSTATRSNMRLDNGTNKRARVAAETNVANQFPGAQSPKVNIRIGTISLEVYQPTVKPVPQVISPQPPSKPKRAHSTNLSRYYLSGW